MNLDRSTYEAWLLDRSEGTLTPEQERLLDAFLAARPELPVTNGGLPKLDAGNETFETKNALLHSFPPSGAPDSGSLDDFLAARLEGELSAEQEKLLDRYLYEHPEMARDAVAMAKAKVIAEPIRFDNKATIEKHFPPLGLPDAFRLTDFLIAEAEDDLTAEQQAAVGRYLLDHPDARREQRLIAAARIQREPLAYPWKKALLKRETRVLPLWGRWAAAASIALLMGLGWWLSGKDQRTPARIAQVERPVTTVTTPNVQQAGPAGENNKPVAPASTPANTSGQALKRSKDHGHSPAPAEKHSPPGRTEPQPAVEPRPMPVRAIIPPPVKEPALAQAPSVQQTTPAPPPYAEVHEVVPAALTASTGGQNLGTFVANALRGEVMDAPKRPQGLDRNDLLAMADRAIGAISNEQGGVHVQHNAARKRFLISLGRNFSISASRSR